MPAVSLTRLREQLNWLSKHTQQPVEFHRVLNDVLNFYADHSYRPGMTVQNQPTLPVYRLPPMVNRQLEVMAVRLAQSSPLEALALADELWKDTYLETRSLATRMLGELPPDEAVLERLRGWCRPGDDVFLLNQVLNLGMQNLRRTNASAWVELLQEWIKGGRPASQLLALRALTPAIQDEKFTNLPAVFTILEPFFKEPSAGLKNQLQETLEGLARLLPAETLYFIRKVILLNPNPLNLRITRQLIPCFPEEMQAKLYEILKPAS